MKRIVINLNESGSIQAAIDEINRLQQSIYSKEVELLTALKDLGYQTIDAYTVAAKDYDKTISKGYYIMPQGDGVYTLGISITGKDVMFIEFGAGMTFNKGAKYPTDRKNLNYDPSDYGVGTYPGQTHAFDPKGWWYSENGESIHSYGTPAAAPLGHADEAICANALRTAVSVFGSI